MVEPFRFLAQLSQIVLLGRRARTLAELRDGIRDVADASIYYHTHRFLEQHVRISPEPPNDFAHWAANALGDDRLAEALASLNAVKLRTLPALRARLLEIVEAHLGGGSHPSAGVHEGEEFHFLSTRLFVVPTPFEAATIEDFAAALPRVPLESIYYHVFGWRLREGAGRDDFSAWFESAGAAALARAVERIDPYTMTIEGLRLKILETVKRHAAAG